MLPEMLGLEHFFASNLARVSWEECVGVASSTILSYTIVSPMHHSCVWDIFRISVVRVIAMAELLGLYTCITRDLARASSSPGNLIDLCSDISPSEGSSLPGDMHGSEDDIFQFHEDLLDWGWPESVDDDDITGYESQDFLN